MRGKEEGDARPFIESLIEFVQGKGHALIGGLAVRAHVRLRPTMDLDIMIDEALWPEMRGFLSRAGAEFRSSTEETFSYLFRTFDLILDVRLALSPLDRAALEGAVEHPYKDWKVRVVEPNHLAAMKVKAYSERKELPQGEQDRKDILRLVEGGLASEAEIREILQRRRPDLLPELDEVLAP